MLFENPEGNIQYLNEIHNKLDVKFKNKEEYFNYYSNYGFHSIISSLA